MSSFCDFIQVYAFTTNHYLKGSDYYKVWWLDLVRHKILGLVPLLLFCQSMCLVNASAQHRAFGF